MNCFGVQFPVQPAMASLMALGDQRMRARAALAAGVRQEAQLRAAQPRGCEQRSELPTKSGGAVSAERRDTLLAGAQETLGLNRDFRQLFGTRLQLMLR